MKIPKDYAELAKAAKSQGWTISVRRGGHLAWTSPDGKVITSSATPKGPSSRLALRAQLRRAGLRA